MNKRFRVTIDLKKDKNSLKKIGLFIGNDLLDNNREVAVKLVI